MKISYAVTTHNEHKEISELIPFILEHKDFEDELVIIDDHSDYKTWRVFDEYIHDKDNNIRFFERALYNDFAKHKNFMTEQCAGDYIFNIEQSIDEEIFKAFEFAKLSKYPNKKDLIKFNNFYK